MLYLVVEPGADQPQSVNRDPNTVAKPGFHIVQVENSTYPGLWNKDTEAYEDYPPSKRVSRTEFMGLLYDSEKEAIMGSANVKIKVFVQELIVADSRIDLYSPQMEKALTGLTALGVLAPGRKEEIQLV